MTSIVDEAARLPADVNPAPSSRTTRRASRLAEQLRYHWPLLALGAVAVAVSVVARHYIYPAYSYNRDEPVFLWMADQLRAGVLTPTDGGAPKFFHPWLAASPPGGAFFSHFTIGWPAVLVASEVVFGSPDAGPALGAVLAVLGTYALARELSPDRSLALVAAAVMTASPILAVQGGVYLGYLFSTGLGLLFAAALLSGLRTRRPAMIALAGGLLGCVFLTRPFDAVLWAAAVGAYTVVVYRGQWRRLLGVAGWLAPGALPFLVIALVYNQIVVGHFLQLPNSAADPLDKFGFGTRRMMPAFDGARYPLSLAVKSTLKNGFRLPLFLAGGYLGLVVAWVGLWLRRRERSTLAILAIIAVFPAAYFFHWGMWVSSLVATWGGPIYFIPLYAPLSILIATSIIAAWHHRRSVGIALVATLVVATVPFAISRFAADRRISVAQKPWKDSTASLKGPALVFVGRSGAYLMFYNPFSANTPKLDGPLLYATDRGPANLDLISRTPNRTAYLQRASLAAGDLVLPLNNPARFPPAQLQPHEYPPIPVVTLTKIRVVKGGVLTVHLRIRNSAAKRTITAYLDLGDGTGRMWRTLTNRGAADETYESEWTVGSAGAGAAGESGIRQLRRRLGTLVVGVAFGSSPAEATRPALRQLISYRVSGSSVEVLTPGDQQKAGKVKDGYQDWLEDEKAVANDPKAPPRLDVRVSSAASAPRGG